GTFEVRVSLTYGFKSRLAHQISYPELLEESSGYFFIIHDPQGGITMAVTLPEAFAHRMKEILGEEFPAFLAAYEQPHLKGVRVNPLKCAPETLQKAMSGLRPSPFSPLCFYS